MVAFEYRYRDTTIETKPTHLNVDGLFIVEVLVNVSFGRPINVLASLALGYLSQRLSAPV
jgi:hypothetical protein